jgi:predicted nucleotidyltransferase
MVRRIAPMSHQRQPFDMVLGTVGNVRILRTLASFGGPMPASRLAEESHMTLNGTINVLALLEHLGAISTIGSGRMRLYRLATERPLGAAMTALFAVERQRFEDILASVTEAANLPGIMATWLFGSVARYEDGIDSDIDIVIVIERPDKEVTAIADEVRDRLAPLADRMTFKPSVVSLSLGQVRRLIENREPLWKALQRDARVLAGESPNEMAFGARESRAGG